MNTSENQILFFQILAMILGIFCVGLGLMVLGNNLYTCSYPVETYPVEYCFPIDEERDEGYDMPIVPKYELDVENMPYYYEDDESEIINLPITEKTDLGEIESLNYGNLQ